MTASSLVANNVLPQNNNLSLFKDSIQQKNEALAKKFNPRQSVAPLLLEKSLFIDEILVHCWNYFLQDQAQQLCLIATGGYGRNELFPCSDIDILILLNNAEPANYQKCLAEFSNYLWDIGLKLGQSVRTIEECLQKAADDQTIMTNLLELRLITGNSQLFADLNRQISQQEIWPAKRYFAAKMQEQQQRYTKYHETAYNLEPNIKEGPGGLRDLQNISWIFKYHYRSSTLKELIQHGLLSQSEYSELIAARNILWRIRFALHTLTQRGEDKLLFNYQRDLA